VHTVNGVGGHLLDWPWRTITPDSRMGSETFLRENPVLSKTRALSLDDRNIKLPRLLRIATIVHYVINFLLYI
jgi:hypothetical protein